MTVIIFASLLVIYVVGLVAFLLNKGPNRKLDAKQRRVTKLTYLGAGIVLIYVAINIIRTLVG